MSESCSDIFLTKQSKKKMYQKKDHEKSCDLFVCFVALRPKSTAMVIAGRSVHITTPFSWASLNKHLTSTSCTYFRL